MIFVITNRVSKNGHFGGSPRPNHGLLYLSGENLENRRVDLFRGLLMKEIEQFMYHGIVPSIICAIHGYNVNFEESLDWFRHLDAVFAGTDKNHITIGFSWPAEGKIIHYLDDRHVARDSATALTRAMMHGFELIQTNCNVELKLICHSMGNYVLAEATQHAAEVLGYPRQYPVFSEILMVAADLDNNALEQGRVASQIPTFGRRVTIYHSTYDRILGASSAKRLGVTGGRLGRRGPANPDKLPDNVVVVDASPFTVAVEDKTPHSSYFWSDRILLDMGHVLNGVDRNTVPYRIKSGSHQYELGPATATVSVSSSVNL